MNENPPTMSCQSSGDERRGSGSKPFVEDRHISIDAPFAESEDSNLLDVMIDEDGINAEDLLMKDSLKVEISRALNTLTQREREVVVYFCGLNSHANLTLEEIGQQLGLTRERVRQIKEKAVRRLRYTNRSKTLKPFLG